MRMRRHTAPAFGSLRNAPWGRFARDLGLIALTFVVGYTISVCWITPGSVTGEEHAVPRVLGKSMLVAFFVLWAWRRRARPIGWLFGAYLVFAGVERFLIEIVRAKDDRFLGPFTLAQLTSVVLVIVGTYVMTLWRGDPDPDPGAYLRGDKDSSLSKTETVQQSIGNKRVTSTNEKL